MSRRGRPPHPDILTPREWEVLALLREGLSDEAIAERLGLSIHGAKYHVREILSKLGVSSRQEAAAWQPEERAPVRRWAALPLAARIAAALVIVAAVAGLGVLAWGVLQTDDDGEGSDVLYLPEPASSPTFTRDQMLVLAAVATPDDTRAISLTWTTLGEAIKASNMQAELPESDLSTPTWLVRADAVYDPCELHECGPPMMSTDLPRTPNVGCHALYLFLPDGERYVTGLTETQDGDCPDRDDLTRDLAILLAAKADVYWDEPPVPTAERLSFVDAQDAVKRSGAVTTYERIAFAPNDTPVWLVRFAHRFLEPEGQAAASGTPRPTTVLSCADLFVIVDATSPQVLEIWRSQYDACD